MKEIVELIVAALAGGGLWKLVTWRIRKKQLATENAIGDYRKIEDIIDSYINRMSKMSDTIVELEQENLKLRRQLIIHLKEKEDEQPRNTGKNQ